jgi:hypothetical protein
LDWIGMEWVGLIWVGRVVAAAALLSWGRKQRRGKKVRIVGAHFCRQVPDVVARLHLSPRVAAGNGSLPSDPAMSGPHRPDPPCQPA